MAGRAHRRLRRERGLSLIEAMVVLAILGVVIVAVAPEISIQLRNAEIRNAADAMQAGLQRARTAAISSNENVRFSIVNNLSADCVLSSTAGSWVVSLDDPAGNCDADPSTTVEPRVIAVHSAADGNAAANVVAKRGDGTAANTIVFNPFGRPLDGTQLRQITINSASSPSTFRTYRVDINAVGGVRMCDTQVTATDDPRRCTAAAL